MQIIDLNMPPDLVTANGEFCCTIGNFDGIHLGHRRLLDSVLTASKAKSLASLVISFDPSARDFFSQKSNAPQQRIFSPNQKIRAFAELGFSACAMKAFNQEFANLSPEEFVRQVLVQRLNVKHIMVGEDFCFGKNRSGNFATLREISEGFAIGVTKFELNCMGQEKISSSTVRAALSSGQFDHAIELIARPYLIEGVIQSGHQKGRELGFPTINIHCSSQLLPKLGVYAGYFYLANGESPAPIFSHPSAAVPAVINIGVRPTLHGDLKNPTPVIEAHLLQSIDLRIESMSTGCVYLRHRLRDEKKFPSIDHLREAIRQDTDAARKLLL